MKLLAIVIGICIGTWNLASCEVQKSTLDSSRLELNALCREFRETGKPEALIRIEKHLLAHPEETAGLLPFSKNDPRVIAMAANLLREGPPGARWKEKLISWFNFAKLTPELNHLLRKLALDARETEATRAEARHMLIGRADESTLPVIAELFSQLGGGGELETEIERAINGKSPAVAELAINIYESFHSGGKAPAIIVEHIKGLRARVETLKQEIAGPKGAEARRAAAVLQAQKEFWNDLHAQAPVSEAEALEKLRNYPHLPALARLKLAFGVANSSVGTNPEIRKLAGVRIWEEESALIRSRLLMVIVGGMKRDERLKYLHFAHGKETNEQVRNQITLLIETSEFLPRK